MKAKVIALIIFFLLSLTDAGAIEISATGGWNEAIDKTDLVAGPGSDLNSAYESAPNVTILKISDCHGRKDKWEVYVRRIDANPHGNLTLFVKMTSDGIGDGAISGRDSYMEIRTTDSRLFFGEGDRKGISLQYKLTGMSIQIPPGMYSITIFYTVADIK